MPLLSLGPRREVLPLMPEYLRGPATPRSRAGRHWLAQGRDPVGNQSSDFMFVTCVDMVCAFDQSGFDLRCMPRILADDRQFRRATHVGAAEERQQRTL